MAEAGHVYAQPHEEGALTIITASPEPDMRGIDANSRIGVTFSKSIDISSLNNSTVIVYIVGEVNDITVPGELAYDTDSNTAYFIPDGELSYSTNYRVVVTPAVRDTEGKSHQWIQEGHRRDAKVRGDEKGRRKGPKELTLKNAHLRRQEKKFGLQRTTQYASAQIFSPSLHLGIFEGQLIV